LSHIPNPKVQTKTDNKKTKLYKLEKKQITKETNQKKIYDQLNKTKG